MKFDEKCDKILDEKADDIEAKFEEFEELLKTYDRWYAMSDDHRVYSKGLKQSREVYDLKGELSKIDKKRVEKLVKKYED